MRHALTIFAVEDLARMQAFSARACGWKVAVELPVYAEFELPAGMRFGLSVTDSLGNQCKTRHPKAARCAFAS